MVVNVFWIIKLLHVLEISHLVIIADFSVFFFFVIKVLVRAANVGAGLIAKGLKPENTTNVGIYSQNRVEVYHMSYYISAQYLFSVNEEIIESNTDVHDPVFIELKNNIEFFIHARKYFQLISGSFKTKRSEFMLFSAIT